MGKFDNPPTEDSEVEPKKEEPTKKGIDRRSFLKIFGIATAGALLAPEILVGQTNTENSESNLEIKDVELNKLIEEYIEQKTFLSKEEIKKSLEKCGFIEDLENINIQELEVKSPQKNNTNKDALREALESGLVKLDKDKLNIIQVDFDLVGGSLSGAFYLDEYKSIFINQSKNTKEAKKERIESFIYEKTIDLEYEKTRSLILNSSMPTDKKDQKIKELNNWLVKTYEGSKNVEKISELVERNLEEVKGSVKEFCAREMRQKIITETNLPHEAFHYFYEAQLEKEGYEGPSKRELLAMAIKGYVKRFGENDSSYAKIDLLIGDLDINDNEKLLEFCNNFNGEGKLSGFLEEFLARIYNGALGNTPEYTKKEIEENDYIKKQGGAPLKLVFEDMYHKPTEEELSVLKEMKWNGNSIIKN